MIRWISTRQRAKRVVAVADAGIFPFSFFLFFFFSLKSIITLATLELYKILCDEIEQPSE